MSVFHVVFSYCQIKAAYKILGVLVFLGLFVVFFKRKEGYHIANHVSSNEALFVISFLF